MKEMQFCFRWVVSLKRAGFWQLLIVHFVDYLFFAAVVSVVVVVPLALVLSLGSQLARAPCFSSPSLPFSRSGPPVCRPTKIPRLIVAGSRR